MAFYENLERRIQYIDDNLTLKDNYVEELEALDGIKSDISVGRYLNSFSPFQAAYLTKRANQIIKWIKAEQEAG